MSNLPKTVRINEEGPREGFQADPRVLPTAEKLRLIAALNVTGLRHIQIASFVNPERVPAMADAEAVAAAYERAPGVAYSAIWLNLRGLHRAIATRRLDLTGALSLTASDAFLERNARRTREQDEATAREMAKLYKAQGIPVERFGVLAAFGCNFQGDVPRGEILRLIGRLREIAAEEEVSVRKVTLADTMGWASPEAIKSLVAAVRDRFPDLAVCLHLHDTRGLGIANAYAGLEMGVAEFDACIGGLGGCPFTGPTAAGNIATEELAFMCAEMGIETGLDLDALVRAAQVAEEIFGRALPGALTRAGHLGRFRVAAADRSIGL